MIQFHFIHYRSFDSSLLGAECVRIICSIVMDESLSHFEWLIRGEIYIKQGKTENTNVRTGQNRQERKRNKQVS